VKKSEPLLEEDLEVITLLGKSESQKEDLIEVLRFVMEDLNSLGAGEVHYFELFFFFFSFVVASCFFFE